MSHGHLRRDHDLARIPPIYLKSSQFLRAERFCWPLYFLAYPKDNLSEKVFRNVLAFQGFARIRLSQIHN